MRGRRGEGGVEKMRGLVIGGMVLGLLMCNNGIAELEKKNKFYESVVKIGQGFQEIFGIFGNAIGDALGFNAIKSEDNKSKVGEHFKKIGDGLKNTKEKLEGLAKEINSTPNADTKGVEAIISSASEVIENLIASVTKLVGVTSDSNPIGHNANAAPGAAEKTGVEAMIEGIKSIIGEAEKSGVKIDSGSTGSQVNAAAATDAPAALGGHNGNATEGAGSKLASEVAKADPWAIIDKIKHAKATVPAALSGNSNNNEVGALAASNANAGATNNGAKTNADLAAAVALKAMIRGGKFSAANNDASAVKAAAASAVNKVLGILDEIIRKTVNIELGKIKDAVKGIKYSDTTVEGTETKK